MDTGRFPTEDEGLEVLVDPPSDIKNSIKADEPFLYFYIKILYLSDTIYAIVYVGAKYILEVSWKFRSSFYSSTTHGGFVKN